MAELTEFGDHLRVFTWELALPFEEEDSPPGRLPGWRDDTDRLGHHYSQGYRVCSRGFRVAEIQSAWLYDQPISENSIFTLLARSIPILFFHILPSEVYMLLSEEMSLIFAELPPLPKDL